jgi:hypothetical protein
MTLRRVAVTCHLVLVAALAASLLAEVSLTRLALAAIVTAPLLATLRGLVLGRRPIEQRLAVLLVAYIGGTSVEVVARAGGALGPSIALLAAALELGVLLGLIRRASPPARDARE